jgi:hypothetical protein
VSEATKWLGALLALLLSAAAASPAEAALHCLRAPWTATVTEDQRTIRALLDSLAPAFARHPSLAEGKDRLRPTFCLDDPNVETQGYLVIERVVIVLTRDLPEALQRGILLHELRHLDQVARGMCPAPTLSMRENARAVFAIEADASAVSLHVAWDLMQLGDSAPWEALAGWDSQADIAARYVEVMGETGNGATATAAAFRQWYDGADRVERYYVASCSDYLDRQEEARALPVTGTLDPAYFANLCRLPDGTPYPCAPPEELPRR